MAGRFSNLRDSIAENLEKRGVKARANKSRNLNFVGKTSGVSFAQALADNLVTTPTPVLGEQYASAKYESSANSGERVYEPVYGDSDYTTAVAGDPTLRQQLDEVFGSKPAPEASQIGEASLISVLGLSSAVPNLPGLSERRDALVRAQDGARVSQDDESDGVRGVEADDAPIEPFA